ncbi:MAG: hypothetical protein D6739_08550, partial [Nitrospirae bacterium]
MGRRATTAAVAAIALAVAALALAWPYPLDEGDQGKQAQYVLDCVVNHHWLVPREIGVVPATKPPLYTWLAALASKAAGDVSLATVQAPALASGVALALLVLALGRRLLPEAAAAAGAVAFCSCHHFARITAFMRTDGLLALFLTLQLDLYLRVRERERPGAAAVALLSLASAGAWLTKGPIGGLSSLVIALHLAVERRWRRLLPLAVAPAAAGAAALGAWFAAALAAGGRQVYETMVVGELARHAAGHGLTDPLYYLGTTLVRITPYQLLLPAALWVGWRSWRAGRWRRPSGGRALLLVWPAGWLAVLGLISHQRPDLFFPALPPLFLLLGLALAEPGGGRFAAGLGLLLAAAAAALPLGLLPGVVPEGAPPWVAWAAAAALAAGGGLALL